MAEQRGRFDWIQPALTGLLLLTLGGASSSITTYLSAFREDITALKLQVAKLETALAIKGDVTEEKVVKLEKLCGVNDSRIDALERWRGAVEVRDSTLHTWREGEGTQ